MEVLTLITTKFVAWLPIVIQTVGVFALVASKTANKSDDKIVDMILKVINFLGANFDKAKNSE